MNRLLILFIFLFVSFMSFQFIISKNSKNLSSNRYQIIEKFKEFEIRKYESLFVASNKVNTSLYDKGSSYGFRTLANYIFGQNNKAQKIPMTSPVIMDMKDSIVMSFIMPKNINEGSVPKPLDSRVKLELRPSEIFAVIRFSGWASDKKIQKKTTELKSLLSREKIKYFGDAVYFGYNPPYQMVNRRNEIAIRVIY